MYNFLYKYICTISLYKYICTISLYKSAIFWNDFQEVKYCQILLIIFGCFVISLTGVPTTTNVSFALCVGRRPDVALWGMCSRVSLKYTFFIILTNIQNVAVCIPYKITGKRIGILNGLGHECTKVLIIQRKSQNIQRKICDQIVLALISHRMVQSIYFLDQVATFVMLFP